MKAVVNTVYGPPDVLHLTEVAPPTPTDDELLIKVQAVSVNRSDWEGLTGKPLYGRFGGLFNPGPRSSDRISPGEWNWLAATRTNFTQAMKYLGRCGTIMVVLPSMCVRVEEPGR